MCGGVEQRLVLVLPVKLDQPRRQILQRAGRRQRTVDERPAASLGGNLAADEKLFSAALEEGLDGSAVLAGPDQLARSPPAEQQALGLDHNGLARAGFAGQDVQAGIELNLDRVD